MSTLLSKEDIKENIIRMYIYSLKGMGYTESWILNVFKSSIKGYMRVLKLVRDGKAAKTRDANDTIVKRIIRLEKA